MKHPDNDRLLRILFGCWLLAGTASGTMAGTTNGEAMVNDKCVACHRIDVPDPATMTLAEKKARKAPPLHYAGHKYQAEWLGKWLVEPVRITPSGGAFWSNNVVVTDEGDVVDESALKPHMQVNAEEAADITEYLMTLKPYPDLVNKEEYVPGKVMGILARKNFRKFKGCVACHRDEEDFGGVTGPELYTTMKRLQPEYVASYIRDPLAWEPKSLMPNKQLNDKSIHKLMDYMRTLVEE